MNNPLIDQRVVQSMTSTGNMAHGSKRITNYAWTGALPRTQPPASSSPIKQQAAVEKLIKTA